VSCLKIELSLSVAIVRFVEDEKKFFCRSGGKKLGDGEGF
jgi:hypothetical protein